MPHYNQQLIRVNDSFNSKDFPERFGNEIYLSTVNEDFYFKYQSPFSIKYTVAGEERYVVGNKVQHVPAGRALLVNDGCEVLSEKSVRKNGNISSGMSVFLDPALISETRSVLDARDIISFEKAVGSVSHVYDEVIRDDRLFLDFLAGIYQRLSGSDTAIQEDLYYEIAVHLLQFQDRVEGKIRSIPGIKYNTRKEIFSRTSMAREYIASTSLSRFSLDSVARECGMSKFFLIRSFRQIYHTTPQQFHIEQRIRKAKELLAANKHSITEISRMLGYPDIYSFSRQFKQVVKHSPLAFQKRMAD